ncbi:unnamed protein product [Mucor hiemalis]
MTNSNHLERYLMETMFEKSLFSDLSLVFIHPSFPFSMRFNVHKSIVSQSPFLCKLLENMERISNSQQHDNSNASSDKMTSLTIDLAKALTHCGFVLAPFQHIVRRKWQKTTNLPSNVDKESLKPLLSSHIQFVLQWMYCLNKAELMETIHDKDTLRILSVAVLLNLHDLTQACVNRYTTQQLSLDSIMRDLETICQLPRGHPAYLQLRDAALLLLFRFGPENATRLAMLPVDYMANVLSADPLFVTCEFERYCLLRAVLMAFMHSVGKITWTSKGPVDQDSKRLSGFVRPFNRPAQVSIPLTADTVRSRKRKRIPSEELEDITLDEAKKLNRLSFTALVPFEKLVADASSGGVIDKATVLSYLLRTTVNYSNMTFDQLTSVRQDGIVDEGIVFRALWQREALERVLFPLTYHQQTQEQDEQENERRRASSIESNTTHSRYDEDRVDALNEYFDVDDSDAQEKRRRLLLGTPRFRFRSSVVITPPEVEENGWECEEKVIVESQVNMHAFDDGDESDGSLWSISDPEEEEVVQPRNGIEELEIGTSPNTESASTTLTTTTSTTTLKQKKKMRTQQNTKTKQYKLYKKTFYSEAETILGISYRVQIEAQVMPRHRLIIQDDAEEGEESTGQFQQIHNHDELILVCRFELQRDMKQIALPPPLPIKKEGAKKKANPLKPRPTTNIPQLVTIPTESPKAQQQQQQQQRERLVDAGIREKTKIHYWIHCLNRHEGILENDRIDPEDRVLVAVTEQCERENGEPGEMEPGYVGQVLVEADLTKNLTVDATVALEIFGFHKV